MSSDVGKHIRDKEVHRIVLQFLYLRPRQSSGAVGWSGFVWLSDLHRAWRKVHIIVIHSSYTYAQGSLPVGWSGCVWPSDLDRVWKKG